MNRTCYVFTVKWLTMGFKQCRYVNDKKRKNMIVTKLLFGFLIKNKTLILKNKIPVFLVDAMQSARYCYASDPL